MPQSIIEKIVNQKMAASTYITAFDVNHPIVANLPISSLQSIKIATKPPRTMATSLDEFEKETRRTHVLFCEDFKNPMPTLDYRRLPDMQPECPELWSAEDWDSRYVLGNAKFHFFKSGIDSTGPGYTLVLKVSNESRNGKWVYEDMSWTDISEMHSFVIQADSNLGEVDKQELGKRKGQAAIAYLGECVFNVARFPGSAPGR